MYIGLHIWYKTRFQTIVRYFPLVAIYCTRTILAVIQCVSQKSFFSREMTILKSSIM